MTEASAILMGAAIGAVASITTQIIQQVFVRRKDRAVDLAEQFASMWHLEQLYLEEIENLKAGKESFVKSDKAAQIKIDMRAINVENGNIPIEFTAKTSKAFAKQMKFFF